jgi:hypothetical protein
LQKIVLPTITLQLKDDLEKAKAEQASVKNTLDKLERSTGPDAANAGKEPGPDSAAGQEPTHADGYREALQKNLHRQFEGLEKRSQGLAAELAAAALWQARACNLERALEKTTSGFIGVELMMGYAFDVVTNPGKDPKSGVIGGAGTNFALGGVAFGFGIFLHEAGIIGGYADLGIPLFN